MLDERVFTKIKELNKGFEQKLMDRAAELKDRDIQFDFYALRIMSKYLGEI